jgi:hypothetical protein
MLDNRVLPSLLPGGAYNFLISEHAVDDPFALDVQLRERNKIMYYHGTSRVLTVQLRMGSSGVEARAHAAEAYGKRPECQQQYQTLMQRWVVGDANAFRAAFLAYLPNAISAADPSHYGNQQEGYWQNRLCVRYGKQWTSKDEWLIIDRECVVGCNNAAEKANFYERIAKAYQDVKDRLQTSDTDLWGPPDGKAFGDELDMLAINRSGELVAIELKYGKNTSGIYWGPLQVGVYHDAYEATLGSIRGAIRNLVQQKIALGVLPQEACGLLDASSLMRVEPVLAIAEPKDRSECWHRMKLVMNEMDQAGIPRPLLPLRIVKIHEANGDPMIEFMPASQGDGAA